MPILRIKTTADQYATIRAAQHLAPDPPEGVATVEPAQSDARREMLEAGRE